MGPQFYHYTSDFVALAKKKLNSDISGVANFYTLQFSEIKLSNIVQKLDRNYKEEKAGIFYEPDLTGRSKPHISLQNLASIENPEGITYLSLEKAPRNRAIINLLLWPDFKTGSSEYRHIHDLRNSYQVEELIELKGKASFSVLNPDYRKAINEEPPVRLNQRKWFETLSTSGFNEIEGSGKSINRIINLLLVLAGIGLLFLNPMLGLLVLLFLLFRILWLRRRANRSRGVVTPTSGKNPQEFTTLNSQSLEEDPSFQANKNSSVQKTYLPSKNRGCFQRIFGIFKWILGIIFLLGILTFLFTMFSGGDSSQAEPTDTGNVKLENIKEEGANRVVQKHTIDWNVIERDFSITYFTNGSDFKRAKENHKEINGFEARDSRSFFRMVYQHMIESDNSRIDSIVNVVRQAVSMSNLNQLEAAEYVVGLIQEIPYVLVHDNTCEEVVNQNGSFVREWHIEGKPCLASIPAGVQSPYEFLHNMKGDCDTRSLLGHAILTKLGIHSSIWISEKYGHSILGVAVPGVTSSAVKQLDGLNHFGVELTAKGFRIGMISPNQMDIRNWNVALFN